MWISEGVLFDGWMTCVVLTDECQNVRDRSVVWWVDDLCCIDWWMSEIGVLFDGWMIHVLTDECENIRERSVVWWVDDLCCIDWWMWECQREEECCLMGGRFMLYWLMNMRVSHQGGVLFHGWMVCLQTFLHRQECHTRNGDPQQTRESPLSLPLALPPLTPLSCHLWWATVLIITSFGGAVHSRLCSWPMLGNVIYGWSAGCTS